MKIRVMNEGNEIYLGDADEFLFANDNDEEIEIALNRLELEHLEKVSIYGNLGDVFDIYKEIDLVYE